MYRISALRQNARYGMPDLFMYRGEWLRAGKGEDVPLRMYEKPRVLVLGE